MVVATWDQMKALRVAGVKDSKQLTARRREAMESAIVDGVVSYGFTVLEAEVVGDARHNINHLEIQAMAMFIRQVRPQAVYVDVPVRAGKALENFCVSLSWLSEFPRSRILGANKADQRFPIVSAASILAKLHRDRLVGEIKARCGDFGSGYPSDPRTVAYLKDLVFRPERMVTAGSGSPSAGCSGGTMPTWIRTKWETYRLLAAQANQTALF